MLARCCLGVRAALLAVGLAAWFMGEAVRAQEVRSEPTPLERCLTVADHAPEVVPSYPTKAFQQMAGGRVKAELVFTVHDRAPTVNILVAESEADRGDPGADHSADFASAIRSFARYYRAPCLAPSDVPARVVIEYVFRRDQPVPAQSPPLDPTSAERQEMWRCVRHLSGESKMAYPTRALRDGVQGRVMAHLRFVAADRPPEVKLFARDSAQSLTSAVRRWLADLRLPCHAGAPFDTAVLFVFRTDREAFGFMPGVTFGQLVGALPGAQRAKMPPDTTGMACPFRVRLTYLQPWHPNTVRPLSAWSPAQAPFFAWLQSAVLELPDATLDAVYADDVDVTVPCLKIQPTP